MVIFVDYHSNICRLPPPPAARPPPPPSTRRTDLFDNSSINDFDCPSDSFCDNGQYNLNFFYILLV